MSGVFRNIDHRLTARRVSTPRLAFGAGGEDILAGGRGVGGSIVRKTPDTAMYSIYVSILRWKASLSPMTMILWMWMNWISGSPSLTTSIWIRLARNPNSPVVGPTF